MKIFVGGISPEGDRLLHRYLDTFLPEAEIEMLKPSGIKGKIKNHAKRPDVTLVIIDESLYNQCESVAADVLSMSKVHKYIDDEGLEQFLISKFGKLEFEVGTSIKEDDKESAENGFDEDESIIDDFLGTGSSDLDFSDTPIARDDSSVNDDKIEKLQAELDQSKMMVRNLEAQLRGSSSDSDVKPLIQRIKSLTEQVEERDKQLAEMEDKQYINQGKVQKAEKIISELKDLKDELRQAKEEVSQLQYEKSGVETKCTELEAKVSSLTERSKRLSGVEDELVSVRRQLESVSNEYESSKDKLSGVQSRYDSLSEELSGLQEQLKAKNIELGTITNEKSIAEIDLESFKRKASSFEAENKELKLSVEELRGKLDTIEEEKDDLLSRVTSLSSSKSDLTRKNEDLHTKLSQLELDNEDLLDKVSSLEDGLSKSKERVTSLIEERKVLSERVVALEGNAESVIENADKLEELERENKELSSKITNLEEELAKARDELEESHIALRKATEVDEVEDTEIKVELETLRGRYAKLEEDYNKLVNDSTTLTLRNEVSALKRELAEAKSFKDDDSEVVKLRNRCAELEMSIASKEEELLDINSSVFMQMLNCALPKVTVGTYVDVPSSCEGMTVIGCGSSESNMHVYKLLSKSCQGLGKSVLVLDLCTDTYIDAELQVQGIKSPYGWLSGSDLLFNYVAPAGVEGVSVVSIGLSYINPLYLLTVDWVKRLEELSGMADNVVINVGCLSNIVAKVLFQSFSKAMRSIVVVKATPVNIRASVLTLAGIGNMRGTSVYCVNFEEASRGVYKRLAGKYDTHILKSTEVLPL